MQRPVMNPSFFDEESDLPDPRRRLLRRASAAWLRSAKLVAQILLYDPIRSAYRGRLKIDEGTRLVRLIRGTLYRLAFLPFLITLLGCVLVYAATHGDSIGSESDPSALGVYFEAVTCLASDRTPLDAWLVPVLDARRVLDKKERTLRERHAAVVLVHDIGNRRQQMLPLVKPLHDAGYVVLVLALRGSDPNTIAAQTFGLREAMDVRAAVEMLRRRSFVEPSSVSVVGIGTGATAALLAVKDDRNVAALVLDHPTHGIEPILQSRLSPQPRSLHWLRPLCKWIFEIGYQLDADEIDLKHHSQTLTRPGVLVLDDPTLPYSLLTPGRTAQLLTFLSQHGRPKPALPGIMVAR